MYDEIFYNITAFITVFITNFIFFDFFKSRYEKKYKKFIYFLYLLLFTMIVVYVNRLGSVIDNYIVNLAQFVGLGLLFEFKNKTAWIMNIAFFLIIAFLDMACFIMIDTSISLFGGSTVYSFSRSILEMVLESMILFIVYYLAKSLLYQRDYIYLKVKDILIYLSISFFSWILCYSLTIFSIFCHNNVFQAFTFVVTIIILVLNVAFISFEETISKKHELERNIKLTNEKSELVLKYYKRIEEKENKNAMFLHDIKNHLQTIQSMINVSADENVISYFDKIERSIDLSGKAFFCDNSVLEVLINDKIEVAKKYDILIDVKYDNTDISFISEFDLVTILANMFDNAIDALDFFIDYEISEKKITLIIKKIHSYLIIKMTNPCSNPLKNSNGVIKTTKKNHSGLGIMNIKSSAAKYKAECIVDLKGNDFNISVLFPLDNPF